MSSAPRKAYLRSKGGMSYGWGHVIRSIALGQHLKERTIDVLLGVDGDEGVSRFLGSVKLPHFRITSREDEGKRLAAFSPDLVIVDMLEVPADLASSMRATCRGLALFNDLSLDYQQADLTISPQILAEYSPPRDPQVQLKGPDYFIVSERMLSHRPLAPRPAGSGRCLVVLGGCMHREHFDLLVSTFRLVKDLRLRFDVVLGFDHDIDLSAYDDLDSIGVRAIPGTDDLGRLMAASDFAIGASGYVKYEFAALGLPSLLVSIVDHQEPLGRIFAERSGSAEFVGDIRSLEPETLATAIRRLARDDQGRATMSSAGLDLVDGRALQRIATALLAL